MATKRLRAYQDVLNREPKNIDFDGKDRKIDVRISRLRKKLGDSIETPFRIKTVWGQGYLFAPEAWNN